MNRNISIQLKAAFLLAVFALNTVVGFACAIGIDMGFTTFHHKDETAGPSVHVHADGKKHHHEPKPEKSSVHVHADGKKHDHPGEPVKQHHEEKTTPKKGKDDCCNDDVQKFQNLDKNLNQNAKTAIVPPSLANIISIFFGIDIFKTSATPQLPVIRYLFPPPPNILVIIQRFQI